MHFKKYLAISLILLTLTTTASAGTYTVSFNGTGADYSITEAQAYASSNTGEDITFLLAGEDYGDFTDSRTTTETNWVRYKAADPENPPIFGFVTVGKRFADAYIELDGVHSIGSIRVRGDHVNIKNCDVEPGNWVTYAIDGGSWGTVHYGLIENCTAHYARRGILVGGDNWRVRNNTVYYIAEHGIRTGTNSNILIENNLVYNVSPHNDPEFWKNRDGTFTGGTHRWHADGIFSYLVRPVENIIIRNNIVHSSRLQGGGAIYIDADMGNNPGFKNIRIENNLVYNIDGAVFLVGGVDDMYINNNTFINNGPTLNHLSTKDAKEVHNNIFSKFKLYPGHSIESEGNNIFGEDPDGFNPDSTSDVLSSQAFEALFVDYGNNDFHLISGSQAIGFGNPAYGPSDDLEGNLRDADPDAGAYEFASACDIRQDCDDAFQCKTLVDCVSSQCVYSDKTGSCNDGDACTTEDTCTSGTCSGTQKNCNDNKACTTDSCSGGNCQNTPNNSACGTSTTCTTYTCSTIAGCQTTHNTGATCNDGIACTQGDSCDNSGNCLPGTTQDSQCPNITGCTNKTCTTTGCQYTPTGCAIPPDLVLWMPLDGDMQNSSGNSNHGTCSTCPALTADKDGNPDSAYEFDGSPFIEIADNPSIQLTGSMTISAWINRKSTSGYDSVVGKSGTSGTRGYNLTCYSGDLCMFAIAENASNYVRVNWTPGFTSNTWWHIAGVYDAQAQTLKLYRNGTEVGSKTSGVPSAQYSDNGLNLNIGREGSTRYPFNGSLDDVRIYSKALSQAEIEALYNEAEQQCVDTPTLLNHISSWKQGSLGMASLMQKLEQWKAGTGCTA